MDITNRVWTEKYRPQNIETMILNEENKSYFSSLTNIPNNLLFIGRPGCGKTTLAKILAKKFSPNSYIYINASDENGIDIVRNKISDFISTMSIDGNQKIVILDECDGLTHAAQNALRGVIEEYLDDVKFILTGNYKHKLIEALISRCQTFEFSVDLKSITRRIVEIIKAEGITFSADTGNHVLLSLIKKYFPDIRKTINEIQKNCVDGKFVYKVKEENEVAQEIYKFVKAKTDAFKIREYVISKESEFNNDYHFLMRNLFDEFIKECNVAAVLLISDYMYKDALVSDKEVNFSALIFNLTKVC
jgi:DNA polymerase III delta prime subunit